jgi:hypothetical protein
MYSPEMLLCTYKSARRYSPEEGTDIFMAVRTPLKVRSAAVNGDGVPYISVLFRFSIIMRASLFHMQLTLLY